MKIDLNEKDITLLLKGRELKKLTKKANQDRGRESENDLKRAEEAVLEAARQLDEE